MWFWLQIRPRSFWDAEPLANIDQAIKTQLDFCFMKLSLESEDHFASNSLDQFTDN